MPLIYQRRNIAQGWIQPNNSKILHYILFGRSLCRRWVYEGRFRPSINLTITRCTDCVRYLEQRLNNLTLPVPPPQPRPPRLR